jgi:hypothetical protein
VSTLSIGLAALSLDFMIHHAESMMQISLMASCLVLGAETVLLFLDRSPGLGFIGLFVLICTALYAYSVQRRIPFAAANLRTALSAIETNYGVCMVAYAVAAAANLFVVLWLLAFAGIAFKHYGSSKDGLVFTLNPYLVIFMILSYYWTSQVLQVRARLRRCGFICRRLLALIPCSFVLSTECRPCHGQWHYWYLVVCTTRSTQCIFTSDCGFVFTGYVVLVRQYLFRKPAGSY